MLNSNKFIVVSVFGLLAACSADQCGDPNKDGLGTALGCTIGPGYQQQTDALAAEVAQKQSIVADLRAENDRLGGLLGTLNTEQQAAARQMIRVNSQVAALDEQLTSQLSQAQISQSEYNLLKSQLNDLNNRRGSLNPTSPADAMRIAELESEIADLKSLF